jgi:hypothetical protein
LSIEEQRRREEENRVASMLKEEREALLGPIGTGLNLIAEHLQQSDSTNRLLVDHLRASLDHLRASESTKNCFIALCFVGLIGLLFVVVMFAIWLVVYYKR